MARWKQLIIKKGLIQLCLCTIGKKKDYFNNLESQNRQRFLILGSIIILDFEIRENLKSFISHGIYRNWKMIKLK